MDLHGPNDAWPSHSRDYFRSALSYAREAGWSLGTYDGHNFGKVICDPTLSKDLRCEFLVFSTGKGGESAALELRSKVDRCPHRNETSRSAVTIATELLDGSDLLIEAAQVCMGSLDKRARVDELLSLAYEQTEIADQTVEQATDLDSDAQDDLFNARNLADSAGYSSEDLIEPEPLLDVAEARADLAAQKVSRLGSSRARERVRQRAVENQAKILTLREQFFAS